MTDKKDEMIQRFEQKTAGDVNGDPVETVSDNNSKASTDNNLSQTVAELQKKLDELEKEKDAQKKALDKQNAEKERKTEQENSAKNEEAVHSIMSDYDNFKKDYNFTDNNGSYKVSIELRPITLGDYNEISRQVALATDGTGRFYLGNSYNLIEAIETFKQVGVHVPEELKDPDKIMRFDIVLTIYNDYNEWLDTFRNGRRF